MSNRKPLSRAFNCAVDTIARKLFPAGFDVSDSAPSSIDEILHYYNKYNRLCVWSGESDQTIFADREINYAFRAWHDHAHIRPYLFGDSAPYAFDYRGEGLTLIEQMNDIRKVYGRGKLSEFFAEILHAEIIGEFDYCEKYGGFPIDQYGFVSDYLLGGVNFALASSRYGVSVPQSERLS